MTSKKVKTAEVDRSQYLNYKKKAEEFYKSMLHAEKEGYWSAVGLNAVHCAISIADALLVRYGGRRSIDRDHMVALDLMKQNLKIDGVGDKLSAFRRILAKKSLIEYDNAVFSQHDALEILKQAERFYIWARQEL
jgi:HEPN domain-containing protein